MLIQRDTEEESTLVEVPFVGPVDERECFEFDSKEGVGCFTSQRHLPTNSAFQDSCPLLVDVHGRTSSGASIQSV